LKYAIENGIIDVTYVQEKVIMQKRKEILDEHPYKIWEEKNGKWYTYLPDEAKGRILKKRNSKKDIEYFIVNSLNANEIISTIQSTFDEWTKEKLEFNEMCLGTYDRYLVDFEKYLKPSQLYNIAMDDIEE